MWINGANIFSGEQSGPALEIKWPGLLRTARSISLVIDLQWLRVTGASMLSSPPHSQEPQEKQVNKALHSLHIFLFENGHPTTLNIKLSSNVPPPDCRLREVLSSMCALAGSIEDTNIKRIDITDVVATEIRNTTAGYRNLASLKSEVELAAQIQILRYGKNSHQLKAYRQLVAPVNHSTYLCIYIQSSKLEPFILRIEDAIEAAANEDLEGLPHQVVEMVEQLKEMRLLRNELAEGKGHNQKL